MTGCVRRSLVLQVSSASSSMVAQASSTAPAGAVVAQRGGEAEAAQEVEGGLHERACARAGLVDPEQLHGLPVGLATDAPLQRRDRRCSSASVRAATHSSSAAKNTGETKCAASTSSTARVRGLPRGNVAARSNMSSRRRSPRCSTAATTRSFLLGKWCSWAPRDTPARLTPASWRCPTSRARPGTRPSPPAAAGASRECAAPAGRGRPSAVVTRQHGPFKQTVKPACLSPAPAGSWPRRRRRRRCCAGW